MRALAIGILTFAAASLVGPAIRWATWPPIKFEVNASSALNGFVSDVLLLMWPTQPLAVIEVNTGSLYASALAVGANILLFALLGLLVGGVAQNRIGLILLYIAFAFLVVLLALWDAGFSITYLNVPALAVGLLWYAIPFYLTAQLVVRCSKMRL